MIDMRAEVAALPRKTGAVAQVAPLEPRYITFHYSAVAYADRSHAAERARILDEARYHLAKNWRPPPKPGEQPKPPIYGSRYQYHWVVLSDGTSVLVNDPVQLWHCGNATGNAQSIAVHVMLGGTQDLTMAQRAGVWSLFGRLRTAHQLAADRVVGHCEWPRERGAPEVQPEYHQARGQSECPGRVLFRAVSGYRVALDPAPPEPPPPTPAEDAGRYRARSLAFIRDRSSTVGRKVGEVKGGAVVEVVRLVRGGTHAANGVQSNLWAELRDGGYVWSPQLVRL